MNDITMSGADMMPWSAFNLAKIVAFSTLPINQAWEADREKLRKRRLREVKRETRRGRSRP
jgi:hypothetical protein